MHDPMPELRALVLRHAAPLCRELLPRLTLWTSYGTTPPTPVIYEPMLYFPLQGIKRMTVGERQLDHRPGTFLLASIDVPVVCAVVDCSPERPYLGLAVEFEPAAVAALLLDLPPGRERVLDAAQEELEPTVETLAGVASMSVSSFHRHFKAVTGLSPLAYHKQMRLQEARRRLLAEPGAVASVAFSVGYESASQFSREYTRQFGMPPARDAARLRAG